MHHEEKKHAARRYLWDAYRVTVYKQVSAGGSRGRVTTGGAVSLGNETTDTALLKPRYSVTILLEITETSKDMGTMTQPEMFKGQGNV